MTTFEAAAATFSYYGNTLLSFWRTFIYFFREQKNTPGGKKL